MKYQPPVGAIDPNAPYIPRNIAGGGSTGSRTPAPAIEHPQREIVAAITRAGLTPSAGDLTQLAAASKLLAQQSLDRIQIASVAATTDTTYRPGVTLPGGAHTRASSGTYYDVMGAMQTAATSVARITADPATGVNRGLLIEAATTNYLLNSATPATQTVTLAAGTYCLWVNGTGSATLSGEATGVATAASRVTFTLASGGSVVVTVAGSLSRFQLENGTYPTSFIATAGATVTRAADVYSEANAAWWNPAEGAFYLSYYFGGVALGQRTMSVSDGSINNTLEVLRTTAGYTVILALTLGGVSVFSVNSGITPPAGVVRLVVSYGPTETIVALNGTIIITAAASPSLAALTTFKYGRANNTMQADAGILRRAYFPRALSQDIAKRMTMA